MNRYPIYLTDIDGISAESAVTINANLNRTTEFIHEGGQKPTQDTTLDLAIGRKSSK